VNVGSPKEEPSPASQVIEAEVVQAAPDGTTQFLQGDLGRVTGDVPDAELNALLGSIGPMFRVAPDQLRLERVDTDELGNRYFRFSQVQDGVDVVGGSLMVHVDSRGSIFAVNGNARGDFQLPSAKQAASNLAGAVDAVQAQPEYAAMAVRANRTLYVHGIDGAVHLAHESVAEGFRSDGTPVIDYVYTDTATAEIVAVHPKIHTARNRNTYNLNNGTSFPGTLARTESQGPVADAVVNAAHDGAGNTYDTYNVFYGRDSYNGQGATINSHVHYSRNYVNAYWDGSKMVYGDGDGVQASSLAVLDVIGHEISHAVTTSTSNLTYSYEPGALNEAFSDIFGAVIEWRRDGQVISANTWLVGEECWTPGTAGDALRYMANPTQDNYSKDYYPERLTGAGDNGGVHGNSGIANLAFKLLVTGGTHPRGKTTVVVPAIGMEKAAKILYEANAACAQANTNFAGFKTCTVQKAQQFYGATEADATTKAWEAVGVGGTTPPPPPPPTGGPLTNNVPVTGISGAVGSEVAYTLVVPAGATNLSFKIAAGTGSSGDADMYVKFGSRPTTGSYDCRPYLNGNNETCNITNVQAGTYHVVIRGYSAYAGVTLTGAFTPGTTPPPPPPEDGLVDGQTVTIASGATGSFAQYKTITVPAGKTITVKLAPASGSSGDADLYVRKGAAPTTSSYDCRPYTSGNTETCTLSSTTAIRYYIGVRGWSAFKNVTVNVDW
jgi:vibriolysin